MSKTTPDLQEWDQMLPDSPYLRPDTRHDEHITETTSFNSDVICTGKTSKYCKPQKKHKFKKVNHVDNEHYDPNDYNDVFINDISSLNNLFGNGDEHKSRDINLDSNNISDGYEEDNEKSDDEINVEVINNINSDNINSDDNDSDSDVNNDDVNIDDVNEINDINDNQDTADDEIIITELDKLSTPDINNFQTPTDNLSISDLEIDLDKENNENIMNDSDNISINSVSDWVIEMEQYLQDLIIKLQYKLASKIKYILKKRKTGDTKLVSFKESQIINEYNFQDQLTNLKIRDLYHGEIYIKCPIDDILHNFKTKNIKDVFNELIKGVYVPAYEVSIRHQYNDEIDDKYHKYIIRQIPREKPLDLQNSRYQQTYYKKSRHAKYKNNSRKPYYYVSKEEQVKVPLYQTCPVKTYYPVYDNPKKYNYIPIYSQK